MSQMISYHRVLSVRLGKPKESFPGNWEADLVVTTAEGEHKIALFSESEEVLVKAAAEVMAA